MLFLALAELFLQPDARTSLDAFIDFRLVSQRKPHRDLRDALSQIRRRADACVVLRVGAAFVSGVLSDGLDPVGLHAELLHALFLLAITVRLVSPLGSIATDLEKHGIMDSQNLGLTRRLGNFAFATRSRRRL